MSAKKDEVLDLSSLEKEIDALETDIYKKKRELAGLRRKISPESVGHYRFQTAKGFVTLEDLFGAQTHLLMVHNMGRECVMCTTWADGFNGILRHVEDRAAFVVSSPDAPGDQKAFADSRGWKFRMVSTVGTSFAKDMKMIWRDGDKEGPSPGLSVFQKTSGG